MDEKGLEAVVFLFSLSTLPTFSQYKVFAQLSVLNLCPPVPTCTSFLFVRSDAFGAVSGID